VNKDKKKNTKSKAEKQNADDSFKSLPRGLRPLAMT